MAQYYQLPYAQPTDRELLSRGLLGAGISILKADPRQTLGQSIGSGLEGFFNARQALRQQKQVEAAQARQQALTQNFTKTLTPEQQTYAQYLSPQTVEDVIGERLKQKVAEPVRLIAGKDAENMFNAPSGSSFQYIPGKGYEKVYIPEQSKESNKGQTVFAQRSDGTGIDRLIERYDGSLVTPDGLDVPRDAYSNFVSSVSPNQPTPKGDPVFAERKDGNGRDLLKRLENGDVVRPDGSPINPQDYVGFVGYIQPQADVTLSGIGTKSQIGKRVDDARGQIANVINSGDTTIDIINAVKTNPNVIGIPSQLANVLNEAAHSVSGTLNLMYGNKPEDAKYLDPRTFGDIFARFKGTAIDSGPVQSALVGLAYQKAKAQNGSHVTGPDYKYAVEQLAGDSSDPDKLTKTLEHLFKTTLRNTRTNLSLIPELKGAVDMSVLDEYESKFNKSLGIGSPIKLPATLEEFAAIPDVQKFEDSLTPEQRAEVKKRLKALGIQVGD